MRTAEVADDEEVRFYAAAVLHGLLGEGLLRAGTPAAGGGFDAWGSPEGELDARGAVELILAVWRYLGRTPELGELVWFDTTGKGAAYAEEALPTSGA